MIVKARKSCLAGAVFIMIWEGVHGNYNKRQVYPCVHLSTNALSTLTSIKITMYLLSRM